jgi:hypothetical protein
MRWQSRSGVPVNVVVAGPGENFVIDRYPAARNVVGEIAADLALTGETRHRIDFLRADRFAVERDAARDR